MAETKIYKNVRFANRIDTEANWVMNNPTLEPGELAFVGENGDYIMILGDTHKKPIGQIINDMRNGTHDSHIFYPGKHSGSGGGGGGGSTNIPVASATLLGGVKIPEEHISGLVIAGDGTLKNALTEKYDYDRGCFVVNKLYIKDLEYDNKVTNPSFEGDFLTLRADSTEPLAVKSGIVIKSLQTNFDGFLGLSAENKIIIAQTDGTYAELVGISPTGVNKGFISYSTGNNYATIVVCNPLNITTNAGQVSYDPTAPTASIDVSSPPIAVNGQVFNYNTTDNRYNIELDGGLTEENRQKLEQLERSLSDIEQLKTETITDVVGDKLIEAIKNNRTITVTHSVATKELDEEANATYVVEDAPEGTDLESIKLLADIVVDQYGHVIKKKFIHLAWKR